MWKNSNIWNTFEKTFGENNEKMKDFYEEFWCVI